MAINCPRGTNFCPAQRSQPESADGGGRGASRPGSRDAPAESARPLLSSAARTARSRQGAGFRQLTHAGGSAGQFQDLSGLPARLHGRHRHAGDAAPGRVLAASLSWAQEREPVLRADGQEEPLQRGMPPGPAGALRERRLRTADVDLPGRLLRCRGAGAAGRTVDRLFADRAGLPPKTHPSPVRADLEAAAAVGH